MIFRGSSNNIPKLPLTAEVSTIPSKINVSFPETSTNPPFPNSLPPLALIFPENPVTSSAQTITRPPSPVNKPSALIMVLRLTNVLNALGTSPCPLYSPPIKTVPPPLLPEALILASMTPILSPKMPTVPPVSPETSTSPDAIVVPELTGTVVLETVKSTLPSALTFAAMSYPLTPLVNKSGKLVIGIDQLFGWLLPGTIG